MGFAMEATLVAMRTIGISIARPWRDAYEAIWRPERFPDWASGLSKADLRQEDGIWRATGADGPVEITFTLHNAYGVMDHTVHLGAGHHVFVPLRVLPYGDEAVVALTLFRQPDMTDAILDHDAAWVERDLAALKRLLEP